MAKRRSGKLGERIEEPGRVGVVTANLDVAAGATYEAQGIDRTDPRGAIGEPITKRQTRLLVRHREVETTKAQRCRASNGRRQLRRSDLKREIAMRQTQRRKCCRM